MASLTDSLFDVGSGFSADGTLQRGGSFTVAVDGGGGALQRSGSLTLSEKTLGEKVMAFSLIAPTLINWVVLAAAHWFGTAELVDSEGVAHTISRSRNFNFEYVFFNASTTCIGTVCAHVWLTMGAIARRHALGQAGAVKGVGYSQRLAAAEAEAGKPSWAEWVHLALVVFDYLFAAYAVFVSSFSNLLGATFSGVLPAMAVVLLVARVLAPARVAVLRKQRVRSVAFAGGALRGSLMTLMVQVIVLARFAAFAFNMPVDPFWLDCAFRIDGAPQYNLDATTKSIWIIAAPIASCEADLFADGVVPSDSKAMVYRYYAPLGYQFNCTLLVNIYLQFCCVLFFAARGQGLLHDKLFTELDMTKTHVVTLVLWLVGTFGFLLALSVMWAEWTDAAVLDTFLLTAWLTASGGVWGMVAVLWKEALLSTLGLGDLSSADNAHRMKHTVFASMRFVNGQALPEAILLREALKEQSVGLQIVELTAGADINEEVFGSIEQADVFMVFGTHNYGEKTANPACTYFESEYARNAGKPMILLRMIPWEGEGATFDHMQARVLFGMNSLVLSWLEETPMPEGLVDSILAAIEEAQVDRDTSTR